MINLLNTARRLLNVMCLLMCEVSDHKWAFLTRINSYKRVMKYCAYLIVLASFTATIATGKVVPAYGTSKLAFVENKGQIRDQNGKARTDIDYVLPAPGINIFIGNGQLHYQFSRTEIKNMNLPGSIKPAGQTGSSKDERYEEPLAATIHTYRMDVTLVGASVSAKNIATEQQVYYENYYLPGCPEGGISAHSYQKVTYKDVYPDIDWVVYIKGTKLEHEFVVGKNGNASLIQLSYKGCTSLKLDESGNVVATTPMGIVTEKAPVCYSAGGALKSSAYRLEGDRLSYDIGGLKEAVLIDPELVWGTYYGPDSSTSPIHAVKAFDSANIYACGLTWSGATGSIATLGAYQNSFGGGTDGYLVKFDSSGVRLWSTYYGGSDNDWSTGLDCDLNGMVYMCGPTGSTSGMTTAGSQQPTYGGAPYDAFLVKFRPDGTRVWATYAGGAGPNVPGSVTCDLSGNVYLAGDSGESTNIATAGSSQPVKSGGFDWYIIQYDSMGVRQWGTYHGGPGDEYYGNACTDGYNVYLTGWTNSTSGIATAFSHQPVFGGNTDMALVKYFVDGTMSWATYYGGPASERAGGVTCDRFFDIYLFGSTESDVNISSAGSFQPTRSGHADAFLAKFNREAGNRVWGTYIGGPEDEYADYSRITSDDSANIYVIGTTASPSGVATDSAWQPDYGGGTSDAFFAKFNRIGARKWCTYYGGSTTDDGRRCSFLDEALYICGQTNSTDHIATPGGFMPTGGSGSVSYNQGYLAKFADPDTTSIPIDTTTTSASHVALAVGIELRLHPNPNSGTFTLAGSLGDKSGIATLQVTDIAGKVVLKEKAAVHNGVISEKVVLESNLSPGVYFLRVSYPGVERTLTFTKDK
jgi:hypothetical protein